MEFIILFEILKYLWLGFEIVRYFTHRNKEKALIDTVEKINQRLNKLENAEKTKKLDT
jgi:hypothetical protein